MRPAGALFLIFPWSVWSCVWLAPAAFVLDILFGDPRLPWPHPVCLIGRFIDRLETASRAWARGGANAALRLKIAGFLCVALVCACVFCAVLLLVSIPWLGGVFALYFAWAGLATGCLLQTGGEVLKRVESGDPQKGREATAWLVSRDVSGMDTSTLRKTLADTLSENFTDAFMAPFFWLVFTGPCGLWLYKAVSTFDSQWGYLTPKWRDLGFAGAKTDDFLAWAPARLSVLALRAADCAAGLLRGRQWRGKWPGIKRIAKDAAGMPSPNSGWSMAACAWLAGGRMAGPSVYFGELVHKEWLGPGDAPPWDKKRLEELMRLMAAGAWAGAAMLWITGAGLGMASRLCGLF